MIYTKNHPFLVLLLNNLDYPQIHIFYLLLSLTNNKINIYNSIICIEFHIKIYKKISFNWILIVLICMIMLINLIHFSKLIELIINYRIK